MKDKEYSKPTLMDLEEKELQEIGGGFAVAVIPGVGLAVGAVLVAVAYSVVGAGVTVNVGGAINLVIGANHVINK